MTNKIDVVPDDSSETPLPASPVVAESSGGDASLLIKYFKRDSGSIQIETCGNSVKITFEGGYIDVLELRSPELLGLPSGIRLAVIGEVMEKVGSIAFAAGMNNARAIMFNAVRSLV